MFNSYYTNCFLRSKYYDEIKKHYNVLFTFIGGSNLLGCSNAESDYDVTIIVADEFKVSTVTTCYIRFGDDIKLHWYIIPLKAILEKQIIDFNMAALFLELENLSDEFLLDLNDNVSYNEIIMRKHEFAVDGQNYMLNYFQSIIENFDKATPVTVIKPIYYLLYISYIAFNEEPDYKKIKKFKRALRCKALSEELLNEIRPQILKLKDII